MDVWSDPALGDRLRLNLADSLKSGDSKVSRPNSCRLENRRRKSSYAPSLAYGRHRGPEHGLARRQLRHAAVLLALMFDADQWVIPLTLRPMTLSHHGGQICLPGGQIEHNETPLEAAMREYQEELGVAAKLQRFCGELPRQYVFGSDNRVHPMVATVVPPSGTHHQWVPDPVEVEEVVLLPLKTLLHSNAVTTLQRRKPVRQDGKVVDELIFSAPAIQCGKHVIWGATAMILGDLAQLLLPH